MVAKKKKGKRVAKCMHCDNRAAEGDILCFPCLCKASASLFRENKEG